MELSNEELEQICKETLEMLLRRTARAELEGKSDYELAPSAVLPDAAVAPNDPWAHRSEGMRCRTCMWFVAKSTGDHRGALGRCRRRAPTLDGYPAVFEVDWCGDHKLDEAKI